MRNVDEWYAQIDATNRKFAKASRDKQRTMIAQDVINAINTRRIVPERGTYFFQPAGDILPDEEASKAIAATSNACHVCALGGVFAAAVSRLNHVSLVDVGGYNCEGATGFMADAMRHYLRDYFTGDELWDIEHAFECGWRFNGVRMPRSANGRMVAIMQSIIDTGGKVRATPCQ